MERINPQTSTDAFKAVSPEMLADHYQKILGALKSLKKAIYEEVAKEIGWEDKNRVSRRLAELEGMQLVYKTGEKRLTSSKRNANVYALVTNGEKSVEPERIPKTTAADFANMIINKTKMGKLKQCELFQNNLNQNLQQ